MGGGLESRCVGRVYGADGAVHVTICTVHTTGVVTTPAYPHLTSNLQQTKNDTTNVVINITVAIP